ncbi:hypothetical protein ACR80S_12360 [Halomonas sp. MA07-2]|uniref:hypothetical protein n=1 Tax=Halomonas sp. MA07-2 TaxID=3440841 RepID=UPI003EE89123
MVLQEAQGQWLVFTYVECLPAAGWLEALTRKADRLRGEDAVLAGAIEMRASGPEPSIYEMYDLVKGIHQA